MIITYRNPENFDDCIDVHFDIDTSDFGHRWKNELKKLLSNKAHLEKNYCFMGFTESPRDIDFLCNEINEAIFQINRFNSYNKWQIAGLEPYHIQDRFDRNTVMHDENLPVGKAVNGNEMATPGCRLKHDAMNRLHRYFEDLQGEAWGLSNYYKIADSTTKYAIRQLNDLCHELESYVLSYRKSKFEPEWQRPSQINTWLQAPRSDLSDEDQTCFTCVDGISDCECAVLNGSTKCGDYKWTTEGVCDDCVCTDIDNFRYQVDDGCIKASTEIKSRRDSLGEEGQDGN